MILTAPGKVSAFFAPVDTVSCAAYKDGMNTEWESDNVGMSAYRALIFAEAVKVCSDIDSKPWVGGKCAISN